MNSAQQRTFNGQSVKRRTTPACGCAASGAVNKRDLKIYGLQNAGFVTSRNSGKSQHVEPTANRTGISNSLPGSSSSSNHESHIGSDSNSGPSTVHNSDSNSNSFVVEQSGGVERWTYGGPNTRVCSQHDDGRMQCFSCDSPVVNPLQENAESQHTVTCGDVNVTLVREGPSVTYGVFSGEDRIGQMRSVRPREPVGIFNVSVNAGDSTGGAETGVCAVFGSRLLCQSNNPPVLIAMPLQHNTLPGARAVSPANTQGARAASVANHQQGGARAASVAHHQQGARASSRAKPRLCAYNPVILPTFAHNPEGCGVCNGGHDAMYTYTPRNFARWVSGQNQNAPGVEFNEHPLSGATRTFDAVEEYVAEISDQATQLGKAIGRLSAQ